MNQQRLFYRLVGVIAVGVCISGSAIALFASMGWGVALQGLGLVGILAMQHLGQRQASRNVDSLAIRCDEILKALVLLESRQNGVKSALERVEAGTRSGGDVLHAMTTDLVRRVKIYHRATTTDISSIRSDLRVRTERLPGEVVELSRASSLLIPELADLPLPGGWAVTVPTLTAIINEISRNPARKVVVECGSGVSTIWLGFAFRHRGDGHVYALEHDPKYAEGTRAYVRRNGLEQWVTVVDAPLIEYVLDGTSYQWYSLDGVSDVTSIDLLFVDGPPASTGPCARYPAFPVLASKLASNAWLVLDDTVRQEEKDIIDTWLSECQSQVRLRQINELPKSVVLAAVRDP